MRRLSIVTPVAALFFYLAVRTRPSTPPSTPIELYGITTVYIATDDADVVDRARRDPCYAHFDFYFQKYERLIAPQYSYVDPDSPEFVQYGLEE